MSVPADAAAMAAAAPESTQWVWVVQVSGSKIVPAGLCLCVKKQIVIKKDATETLP